MNGQLTTHPNPGHISVLSLESCLQSWGLMCSSVAEPWPAIYEALGSIPSTIKANRQDLSFLLAIVERDCIPNKCGMGESKVRILTLGEHLLDLKLLQ